MLFLELIFISLKISYLIVLFFYSFVIFQISVLASCGPWLAESFQQSSISCLFDSVERIIRTQTGNCRFILAYVSRANVMDGLVLKEAEKHGMCVREVDGTRTTISNLEGVIFDISLKWHPALRLSFLKMLGWSLVMKTCRSSLSQENQNSTCMMSWRCGSFISAEDKAVPC